MSKQLYTARESVLFGLLTIFFFLLIYGAVISACAGVLMLVWNCLIAAPLGLVKIPFIAACGISILLGLFLPKPQRK